MFPTLIEVSKQRNSYTLEQLRLEHAKLDLPNDREWIEFEPISSEDEIQIENLNP